MTGNQECFLGTFKLPTTWNNDFVESIGERLITQLKLKRLGFHSFLYTNSNPQFGGKTFIWFLAESHLILETFRESGILEMELATCRRRLDPQKYFDIFKENMLEPICTQFLSKDNENRWLV